jgi:pseudomonalisin
MQKNRKGGLSSLPKETEQNMKSSFILKFAPIMVLLLVALGSSAQPTSWVATHSHAPDVSVATPGVAMQAGEALQITVSLKIRNKTSLDAFTADLIAGNSSQPLTSAQFLSQYAPSQDQVNAVVAYLSKHGFINIEVAPNNLLITADGSVGTANAAFKVNMQHFSVQGRDAYANLNDPVVPQELGNTVLAVHGLQTVHLLHATRTKAQQIPSSTKIGHSPSAWPTVYGGTGIPTAAHTTIGIIGSGNVTQVLADLNTFVQLAGFTPPSVSTVHVGNASRINRLESESDIAEWDIDSQNALGAAGGAVKSMILYAANSLADAAFTAIYNTVVSANVAKVINVSFGECESDAQLSGSEATDDQIFESAVAQGQTFAIAAGDSGSYECGGRISAQSYPAVSPYVIAVGGTSLITTPAGVRSSETVWSCSSASNCYNNGGTGGGVSTTEAAPTWQVSSGVLGTSKNRGVPDIAFDADPASGALTIINGITEQYGGTSLATPIFVGFWARIQSAHANSLVFPAKALYQYGSANESTIFHDITSGSNGGYSAKSGWDYATGFGSLNVGNFAAFVTRNIGF